MHEEEKRLKKKKNQKENVFTDASRGKKKKK